MRKKKLNIIFSKLSIKTHISLHPQRKTQLVLDIVRSEIRVLIFNIVTKQIYLLIFSCKVDSKTKLDLIFRFLLLSSHNIIRNKLHILFPINSNYTKFQRDWGLSLLDSEDYSSLKYLIILSNSVWNASSFYHSFRLLIEHLVIKISNILIYELILTKKVPNSILEFYTIDIFLCLIYSDLLYIYLLWRNSFKSVLYSDEQSSLPKYFFSFIRKEITIKYVMLNNILYGNKFMVHELLVVRPLKLVDYLIFLLLQVFIKK